MPKNYGLKVKRFIWIISGDECNILQGRLRCLEPEREVKRWRSETLAAVSRRLSDASVSSVTQLGRRYGGEDMMQKLHENGSYLSGSYLVCLYKVESLSSE